VAWYLALVQFLHRPLRPDRVFVSLWNCSAGWMRWQVPHSARRTPVSSPSIARRARMSHLSEQKSRWRRLVGRIFAHHLHDHACCMHALEQNLRECESLSFIEVRAPQTSHATSTRFPASRHRIEQYFAERRRPLCTPNEIPHRAHVKRCGPALESRPVRALVLSPAVSTPTVCASPPTSM
jgi:hypothetical protein